MALDIHPALPNEVVPRQLPGFTVKKIPCCYLLHHKDRQDAVKLNVTGMMIWQVCNGDWTVGEIIEALQQSYPDAADGMAKDVYRALDNLLDEQVITLES